ncbi:MAG: IPExxxVDY family protein [Bacteroidales bacterium]
MAQITNPDIGIAGIVSSLPDYRFVHFLNKELHFRMVRTSDLVISSKQGQHAHPFYYYADPQYGIGFCLAGNRGDNGLLVPGLKNIDYLLLMMQFTERYPLKEALATLRQIPGVVLVQQIDTAKIAGASDIFGLIELHILGQND